MAAVTAQIPATPVQGGGEVYHSGTSGRPAEGAVRLSAENHARFAVSLCQPCGQKSGWENAQPC